MDVDDDGRHDFDFFYGDWRMHNRRLSKPLAGATDWTEYPTTARCIPLLGGLMNVDEVLNADGSPAGATVRTFSVETGLWSVDWITKEARLTTPSLVGRFEGPLGLFYSDEVWEGTPIRCRYTWTVRTRDRLSWEQAFSVDGGVTWEVNFANELTRTGEWEGWPSS